MAAPLLADQLAASPRCSPWAIPHFYRARLENGSGRLVHPREEDVRRVIAREVADHGSTLLIRLVSVVIAAHQVPGLPPPLVRQGWGPLVDRVARDMGVR